MVEEVKSEESLRREFFCFLRSTFPNSSYRITWTRESPTPTSPYARGERYFVHKLKRKFLGLMRIGNSQKVLQIVPKSKVYDTEIHMDRLSSHGEFSPLEISVYDQEIIEVARVFAKDYETEYGKPVRLVRNY